MERNMLSIFWASVDINHGNPTVKTIKIGLFDADTSILPLSIQSSIHMHVKTGTSLFSNIDSLLLIDDLVWICVMVLFRSSNIKLE